MTCWFFQLCYSSMVLNECTGKRVFLTQQQCLLESKTHLILESCSNLDIQRYLTCKRFNVPTVMMIIDLWKSKKWEIKISSKCVKFAWALEWLISILVEIKILKTSGAGRFPQTFKTFQPHNPEMAYEAYEEENILRRYFVVETLPLFVLLFLASLSYLLT